MSQADDELLAAYAAGFEKVTEEQDNKLLNDFMDLYDPPRPDDDDDDDEEQTPNKNDESYLTLSQALNMLSCTQTDEEDERTADQVSDYERTPLDERFADVRDEAGCFEPACSDFEDD
jgi:hypothetical protein